MEMGVVTTVRAEKMAQNWEFGGWDLGPLPTTLWEAMEKFVYVLSGSLAKCFVRTLPFFNFTIFLLTQVYMHLSIKKFQFSASFQVLICCSDSSTF